MKIVQTSIAIFLCMGVVPGYATISINGVQPNNTDAHYLQAVRHMKVPFGSQSGATWEAGNNVVGKTPAEVQAIVIAIRALETDVRQIEIYDRMKSTPTEIFTFGTLAHAKNVVKQRLETVKMMENFNTQQNYWYHTPVNPPSTTAGNWESGARTPFFFRQKDGNASSAITQLCASTTKTYGECYGAISACVWWGAQQGMGDTAFNSLYPSRELNMDFRKSNSSTRNTTPATDTDILVPGDWLYFNNYNYNTIMLTP